MKRGIVVGTDRNTEWLLEWWWGCFSRYNQLPIAFVDFGMSKEKRAWCQEHGIIVDLPQVNFCKSLRISASRKKHWERFYATGIEEQRSGWFKKPWACLHSPFATTIWLDLDCEVCGDLGMLFDHYDPSYEIGIVAQENISKRWKIFNSGVVIFQGKPPLLQKWAKACTEQSNRFISDDNILSHLIRKEGPYIQELPSTFNWCMWNGLPIQALILHWISSWGKDYIRLYGGLHGLLKCQN